MLVKITGLDMAQETLLADATDAPILGKPFTADGKIAPTRDCPEPREFTLKTDEVVEILRNGFFLTRSGLQYRIEVLEQPCDALARRPN